MHYVWGVLLLVVSAPLFGLSVHEYARWRECAARCREDRDDSLHIVEMNVCRQRDGRSRIDQMCNDARRSLQITEFECTGRAYWRESGVAHIYDQIVNNSIALLVLAIACALFTIHKVFSLIRCCGGRRRRHVEKEERALSPPPPVQAIEWKPMEFVGRKKRVRLYDEVE